MSHEQARACLEKMKSDGAFRARVQAASDPAARTRIVNDEGFACTAEEMDAVSRELTDGDLDRVAGGMGINRIVVTDGHINAKVKFRS